jgi:TolB-like protein/DNA-binding winged helix-turn-helix (wHTH) protein/tetratricopeptide (TPR) repeat protein
LSSAVPDTPEKSKPAALASFGSFEVDLEAGEVRKDGLRIKVQEKPFQILRLLLERAGELVTREQLRERLWPGETFVEFDASLKTALNKLRSALGDSADNPRFVETIPRRGYRFVAPVVFFDKEAPPDFVRRASKGYRFVDEQHPVSTAGPRSRRRNIAILGLALLVTIVAVLVSTSKFWHKGKGNSKAVLMVLPFDNLSGDPTQEYFSDGLTDEMITQLGSEYPGQLSVIARTSAMKFKHTQEDLKEISRKLGGVDFFLEGSVRRVGNHVAINVQLVGAPDGRSLWAARYDREAPDLLMIQQDVSTRIAQSLALALIPSRGTVLRTTPTNPSAYDDYLMGLYETNKRTSGALQKSMQDFQRAIDEDSEYAAAYAGLADSYLISAGWSFVPPTDAYPRAREAALKALGLNASLAEAHTALAVIKHYYEWDWPGAEAEFRHALALAPNSANTLKFYAEFLMHAGRYAEASEEIRHARELDPLSPILNALVGYSYYAARQYPEAVEQLRKSIAMDVEFAPAHYFLGGAYERLHRYDDAIAEYDEANRLSGGFPLASVELAYTYAVAGRKSQALDRLHELEGLSRKAYVSSYGIAEIYAGLGDKENALASLQRAYRERASELVFLGIEGAFDSLRDDVRFQDLVKRVGAPISATKAVGR